MILQENLKRKFRQLRSSKSGEKYSLSSVILDFPKITGHFRLSGLSPLGGLNRGRKSQKNQTSV